MVVTPNIEKCRASLKSALEAQASALQGHDVALAKLAVKQKEHSALEFQLETLRVAASEKDDVNVKAISELSNAREATEISARQLQRLIQDASKAGQILVDAWHSDTLALVRSLYSAYKFQLTQEGKQLIEDNFERNPFIRFNEGARFYKPMMALEGAVYNAGCPGGTTSLPSKFEDQLKKARSSTDSIQSFIDFN